MNRNFIGNKKPSLQTGCNILNTGKNIDSIEKINISNKYFMFTLLTWPFLVKALFNGRGQGCLHPLRSSPIPPYK